MDYISFFFARNTPFYRTRYCEIVGRVLLEVRIDLNDEFIFTYCDSIEEEIDLIMKVKYRIDKQLNIN